MLPSDGQNFLHNMLPYSLIRSLHQSSIIANFLVAMIISHYRETVDHELSSLISPSRHISSGLFLRIPLRTDKQFDLSVPATASAVALALHICI